MAVIITSVQSMKTSVCIYFLSLSEEQRRFWGSGRGGEKLSGPESAERAECLPDASAVNQTPDAHSLFRLATASRLGDAR